MRQLGDPDPIVDGSQEDHDPPLLEGQFAALGTLRGRPSR